MTILEFYKTHKDDLNQYSHILLIGYDGYHKQLRTPASLHRFSEKTILKTQELKSLLGGLYLEIYVK